MENEVFEVSPTSQLSLDEIYYQKETVDIASCPSRFLKRNTFGENFWSRSGDKGGCANLGIWAKTDDAFSFLNSFLTVKKLKELP